MSWDVDEKEFYETFAEMTEDRGIEDAKRWVWSALDWTQKELRKKEEELTEERAAVVKWLRAEAEAAAQTYTVQAGQWANRIDGLADDIERGEHRRVEDE